MRKLVKKLYLLCLALSLSVIWANYGLTDFSYKTIDFQQQCEDTTCNPEHYDNHGFEDNVIPGNSTGTSGKPLVKIDLLPIVNNTMITNYTSTIWQPPKNV